MYRFQEVMKTMGSTAAGSSGGLGQFQQSQPQYIPGTEGSINQTYSHCFLEGYYFFHDGIP